MSQNLGERCSTCNMPNFLCACNLPLHIDLPPEDPREKARREVLDELVAQELHLDQMLATVRKLLGKPHPPVAQIPMKLRTESASGQSAETWWLIERGQAEKQEPTIWWVQSAEYQSGVPYLGQWTEDANKASKFESAEQAETFARSGVGHLYRVTEHVFIGEKHTNDNMEYDAYKMADDLQSALLAHPQAGDIPVQPSLLTLAIGELRRLRKACDRHSEADLLGETERAELERLRRTTAGGSAIARLRDSAFTTKSGLARQSEKGRTRPEDVGEWMNHMDLHETEHDLVHAGKALRAAWPVVRAYIESLEHGHVNYHGHVNAAYDKAGATYKDGYKAGMQAAASIALRWDHEDGMLALSNHLEEEASRG